MNRSVISCGTAIAGIFLIGCTASSVPGVRVASAGATEKHENGSSMAKGRMLFARGEYGLAIEAFRLAVREAPGAPDGYNGLAAAYDMMGRFDLSGTYYEMALARAPSDGRIYRNMARSLRMQGRAGESDALLAEWDALQGQKTPAAPIVPAVETARTGAPSAIPAPAVENAVAQAIPAPYSGQQVEIDLTRVETILPDKATSGIPGLIPPPSRPTQAPERAAPVVRGSSVTIALDAPQPVVSHARAAIRIMNAGGRNGIARRMQGYLARSGIGNTQIGDANRRFERSWVVYPRSAREQALALKKQLPFATTSVVDERATRVVLLLGRNAANYDSRHYARGRRT